MPKPTLVPPPDSTPPADNPFPPEPPVATSPARTVQALRGSWLSRDIKEAIISGAAVYGSDGKGTGGMPGYLEMCAATFPKEYMTLLARMVSIQVRGQQEGGAAINIGSINIHPVASDRYLTAAEMRSMATPIIEASENFDDPRTPVQEPPSDDPKPPVQEPPPDEPPPDAA